MRQKRLGVETGLVLDEQLELLVLDGLRVELAVGGVASLEVVAERRVLAMVVLDHVQRLHVERADLDVPRELRDDPHQTGHGHVFVVVVVVIDVQMGQLGEQTLGDVLGQLDDGRGRKVVGLDRKRL